MDRSLNSGFSQFASFSEEDNIVSYVVPPPPSSPVNRRSRSANTPTSPKPQRHHRRRKSVGEEESVIHRVTSVTFDPNVTTMRERGDSEAVHKAVQNLLDMTDDERPPVENVVGTRVTYPDYQTQGNMLAAAKTRSAMTQDSQTAALAGIPGSKKKRPSFIKQSKNFLRRRGSKTPNLESAQSSERSETVRPQGSDTLSAPRRMAASPISNLTEPTGLATVKSEDEWDSESTGSSVETNSYESQDYSQSTGRSSRRPVRNRGLFGDFLASSERALGSIAQSFDQLFEEGNGSYAESDDETRTIGSDSEFYSVQSAKPKKVSERKTERRKTVEPAGVEPKSSKRRLSVSPERPIARKTVEGNSSTETARTKIQTRSILKNSLSLQKRSSSVPRSLEPGRLPDSSLGNLTVYPIERNRSEEEIATESMVMAVESWFGARYGRQCAPARVRFLDNCENESPTIDETILKPVETPKTSPPGKSLTSQKEIDVAPEKFVSAPEAAIPSKETTLQEKEKAAPQAPVSKPSKIVRPAQVEETERANGTMQSTEASLAQVVTQGAPEAAPAAKGSSPEKASKQTRKTLFYSDTQKENIQKEGSSRNAPTHSNEKPHSTPSRSSLREKIIGRALGGTWRAHRLAAKEKKLSKEDSPAKKTNASTNVAQKKPSPVKGEKSRLSVAIFPETPSVSPATNQASKSSKADAKFTTPTRPPSQQQGRSSPDEIADALKRKSKYNQNQSKSNTSKNENSNVTTVSAIPVAGAKKELSEDQLKSLFQMPVEGKESKLGEAKASVESPSPQISQSIAKEDNGALASKVRDGKGPLQDEKTSSRAKRPGILSTIRRKSMSLLSSDGNRNKSLKTTIVTTSNKSSAKPTSSDTKSNHEGDDFSILEKEIAVTEKETSERPISPFFGAVHDGGILCSNLADACFKGGIEYRLQDPDQQHQFCSPNYFGQLGGESSAGPCSGIQSHLEDFIAGLTGKVPAEMSLVEVPSKDEGEQRMLQTSTSKYSQEESLCNHLGLTQVEKASVSATNPQDIQAFLDNYKDNLELTIRNTFSLDFLDGVMAQASNDWSDLAVATTQNEPRLTASESKVPEADDENPKKVVSTVEGRDLAVTGARTDAIAKEEPLKVFDAAPRKYKHSTPSPVVEKVRQKSPTRPRKDSPPIPDKTKSRQKSPVPSRKRLSPRADQHQLPQKEAPRGRRPSPGLDMITPPQKPLKAGSIARRVEKVHRDEEKQEKHDWVAFDDKAFFVQPKTVRDLSRSRLYRGEEKVSTPEPALHHRSAVDDLVFPSDPLLAKGKLPLDSSDRHEFKSCEI